MISPGGGRSSPRIAAAIVVLIAACVFWRTAYPTITWWDSSSYSLAASTLGIGSPPGSLLLTILGWPVAHLPIGSSPAHRLNLFAGMLAAISTGLVVVVAARLARQAGRRRDDRPFDRATLIGVSAGALAFGFSDTLWEHAIRFTPYILTTVVTGLILWTLLRWWDAADLPGSWRWLLVLGLLFGLDFSVHRTNALLLPGALAWILLRRPSTLREPRALVGGGSGLLAGLAVQLLVIPVARFTSSTLNFNEPSNWSRFWSWVSLEQMGGGFLLDVFPRKSAFWSKQVADLVHVLGDNLLALSGPTTVLGALPAVAAVVGLVVLWRRNGRLALAYLLVVVLQALATVLYFNIPANFFRPFDRHYLPVCLTIAVLAAYGLGSLVAWVTGVAPRRFARLGMVACVAVVPAAQLVNNWSAHDASARYFTRDYAANALGGLPPNAIYFTVGDNDTFPLMYVQSVEGVRPDVTIINLSVANLPGIPDQLRRRDPTFPIALSREARAALSARTWTDTTVVVPVVGTAEPLGLAAGTVVAPEIALDVRPTYETKMLPADVTLLDIVQTNRWKRPLAFAITGTQQSMHWLAPYGRLDGLYWRIVPVRQAPPDIATLRSNMLERATYRGYADSGVRIDDVARTMAFQYYGGFKELLAAERGAGGVAACDSTLRRIFALLPLERLALPEGLRQEVTSICGESR